MSRTELTPAERTARARLASFARLSRMSPEDRRQSTANARQAAIDRFAAQIREEFPDLPPAEVAQRAEYLRRAHMQRISLKGIRARKEKANRKAAQQRKQQQGGEAE